MKVKELQKQLQKFIDEGGNPNMVIVLPIEYYDFGTHCELSGFKVEKMNKNGKYFDFPIEGKEEKNSQERMTLTTWR